MLHNSMFRSSGAMDGAVEAAEMNSLAFAAVVRGVT
jgi:hypothetical protein